MFGFIAGVLELWADHYSIATINKLVYPENEAFIWTSPAYMPFSWAVALVQLGYYSLLLIRWKGLGVATVIMTLSGGFYIPLYEHLAKNADWWYYKDTPMIFNAPYYIIICEALLSALLPLMVLWVSRKNLFWSVVPGIIQGVWILLSAIIAFKLVSAFA
ncbi:MAG: hypothetical protein AAFX87_19935 [Bacteroidota bacterium]